MSARDERNRLEGMSYALRYLEGHEWDAESLREDIKRRGAYQIPVPINRRDEEEFSNRVKDNAIDTILTMSLMVLLDEFDFDREQLNRFKARFNEKTECLTGDFTTWEDQLNILADECGIEQSIRWNGADPTKKVEE